MIDIVDEYYSTGGEPNNSGESDVDRLRALNLKLESGIDDCLDLVIDADLLTKAELVQILDTKLSALLQNGKSDAELKIMAWCKKHSWVGENLFVGKLKSAGFTADQIVTVLEAIDSTCQGCWNDSPTCQCWNDL